jgi:hypothetical protein
MSTPTQAAGPAGWPWRPWRIERPPNSFRFPPLLDGLSSGSCVITTITSPR